VPKGIAGLLADRFDIQIFPLRRRVHLEKSKSGHAIETGSTNILEPSGEPNEPEMKSQNTEYGIHDQRH
jgi:hypothetical protein